MVFKILFVTLLVFVTSAPVGFAHRPFATEDAGTLDPGRFELEIGHDYIEHGDGDRSVSGTYTVNAGVLEKLEMDFTVPVTYYLRQDDLTERGLNDLTLVGKYRLLDETAALSALTAVGSVTFPTGDSDKGLGNSKTNYQLLAALTKTIGRVTMHGNVGWDFLSDEKDQVLVRGGFAYEFLPKWHVLGEWEAASDFDSDTDNETSGLLVGFLWFPNPKWMWDAGIRFGTVSEEDNFVITSGLTLAF